MRISQFTTALGVRGAISHSITHDEGLIKFTTNKRVNTNVSIAGMSTILLDRVLSSVYSWYQVMPSIRLSVPVPTDPCSLEGWDEVAKIIPQMFYR